MTRFLVRRALRQYIGLGKFIVRHLYLLSDTELTTLHREGRLTKRDAWNAWRGRQP